MNSRKKGALLTYITLFIKNAANLLVTPFLIRLLGHNRYGIYIIVQSIVAILLLFDSGLTSCTVKYVSSYRAKRSRKDEETFLKTIITMYLAITVAVCAGGVVVCSLIPRIYHQTLCLADQELLKALLAIMLISVAFSMVGNGYNAILVAYERFAFLRTLDIIGYGVRYTSIMVLLLLGQGVIAVIIVDACFGVSINAIKMIVGGKVAKVSFSLGITDKKALKSIMRYAGFVFLASIAGQIYWKIDNLVLSLIGNTSWVTINGVGTQLTLVFIAFSSAIVNVFFPKIVTMVENKASGEGLTNEMIKTGRVQALVIGLLFCGFILFGHKFVILWAGEACREAYYITLAIVLPLSILMVQNLGIYILQAKNLHKFRSVTMFLMAVFNIFLTIIFVKIWGVIGAGIATGVGLLVGNVILLNLYYHKVVGLNIKRFFKELLQGIGVSLLICFALGYLVVIAFGSVSIGALCLQIVVFTVLYTAVMWFVGMNEDEKNYVQEVLRALKRLAGIKNREETQIKDTLDRIGQRDICCGCMACVHICPKKCINVIEDEEGFKYPKIDRSKCIGCGACESVCLSRKIHNNHKAFCYAAWHKDDDIRLKSTSGGAFSAFAEEILDKGGVVYGAAMEKTKCYHKRIDRIDGLESLRLSKYVQSDMGNVMPMIRKDLKDKKWVLFSGTPCQVAGLKAYLGRDHERLLTIDVVCLGVPSPKVFADHIKDIEENVKDTIAAYQFRYKKKGWAQVTNRIIFIKSCEKIIAGREDSYYRGFLKRLILRPACYRCRIKAKCSRADISLGDFWGIERIDKALFSQKGVSLVLCHTKKGSKWIKQVSGRLALYPQRLRDALAENPHIAKPAVEPRKRARFFKDYKKHGYNYVKKKYLMPPAKWKQKLYDAIRKVISKVKS